ncbi:MAG: hypothetical protein LUH51_00395 [Firmicutes bacterium]|nr:hypothetical protein [Bacillota bacterium]
MYKLNQKEIEEKDADLWQHINKSYGGNFRKSPLSADNLLTILEYYKDTVKTLTPEKYEEFEALRHFEKKVRNLAAHTITSISKEDIENACGESPDAYLYILHHQFENLYSQELNLSQEPEEKHKLWDCYRKMNEAIIQELDR